MNPDEDLLSEHFPIVDVIDHEILMHRDAHFGGHFQIMLDYYRQEGKGVQPEFELLKIERLAELESQMKQNLAALFLESQEAEKVAEAREVYKGLRAIYEVKKPKSPFPRLIADLILADDKEAEAEIETIVQAGNEAVPALIDLLRNESFHDPLFPGYGQAPTLAVKCLGCIGDKRAIISLFEEVGQGDFFADDQIIKALQLIGKPAQDFLLHVVKGKPLNEDNEKAAIALLAFKDEEEVANACFDLLLEADVLKDSCLPTYLVLACAGLKSPVLCEAFKVAAKNSNLPPLLREDMKGIISSWEQKV